MYNETRGLVNTTVMPKMEWRVKSIYYLTIIIICVLVTSCASNIAEYPHDWPKIMGDENRECVDLSGAYFNKAYDAPSNRDRDKHEKYKSWEIHLSKLLVPYIPERKNFKNEEAYIVEIKGVENDKLEMILKESGKIVYKKVLNKDKEFTCSSHYLEVKGRSSPENMMGITERFETTKYEKGDDGSLLVSVQETDIGTIVIVPYGEKVVQYYRFLPHSGAKVK